MLKPFFGLDSAVIELLDELEVKPTSKILYEKIRHPETNRMTSVLSFIPTLSKRVNVFPLTKPVPDLESGYITMVSQK